MSDVEGNNELIHDGETGFLYTDTADACAHIVNNVDYAEEAMKLIDDHYDLEEMCMKYKRAYG